ncbi:MAG: AAA family ATPase [Gammaproteobacteria bacterium]|nr:AAA family ATPase [Gammaproteobacteria bacterium]
MPLQNQDRFFLTRQSANIMEDLSRRLNQAGSISLLYGPEGIGKSRLLDQFVETRLTPENSIFVRFNVNNTYVEVTEGKDEFEFDTFFNREISRLNKNFTLLIDQFDNAPADMQLNILKFWDKVAREKDFKLIISIQSNSLHLLNELSQRYQLQIDSVELKPLKLEEQMGYLRLTSCAELRQLAVIPAALKKPLKLTNGLFSQLEAFRSQFGDQISCKEVALNSRGKFKKTLFYSVSGLFLVLLSVIIVQQKVFNKDLLQLQIPGSIFKSSSIQGSKLKIEPEPEPLIVSEPEPVLIVEEEVSVSKINSSLFSEMKPVEPDVTTESISPGDMTNSVKPEVIVADEPEIIEVKPAKVTVKPGQKQTVFEQRLRATEKWLETSDNKLASIQIMTLISGKKRLQSLNRYLNKLKSQQINLEEIKIYSADKEDKTIYGVLYGEYETISMAYRGIKHLPDALNANHPILRTVKGIKDEIHGR